MAATKAAQMNDPDANTAETDIESGVLDAEAQDSDSLVALEERIHRIIELVSSARGERDRALKERDRAVSGMHLAVEERDQALAERDAAVEAAALARKAIGDNAGEAQKLQAEIERLRGERKQVRVRIEKLLGQMDLLSGQ
jgi:hypothetical protein